MVASSTAMNVEMNGTANASPASPMGGRVVSTSAQPRMTPVAAERTVSRLGITPAIDSFRKTTPLSRK